MFTMLQYEDLVGRALREDIGTGDLSSLILPEDFLGEAKLYAKEEGVICGLEIVESVFRIIDSRITIECLVKEGSEVSPGMLVMILKGPLRGILQGERTALNFLQHLSGIASMTKRLTDMVADLSVKVVDTRKTIPGMRSLQKYAVRAGGGHNHRFGLYDGVMLKDNHLAVAGGISEAVRRVKAKVGHMVKIEVECETLDQVKEAVDSGADVIMLDNMSLADMKSAVRIIDHRAIVEASGGIREDTIRQIAETGVDIISVGRLTHSVNALDFSLVIDDTKPSMQKLKSEGWEK